MEAIVVDSSPLSLNTVYTVLTIFVLRSVAGDNDPDFDRDRGLPLGIPRPLPFSSGDMDLGRPRGLGLGDLYLHINLLGEDDLHNVIDYLVVSWTFGVIDSNFYFENNLF